MPADAARYVADLPFAARQLRCDQDRLTELARDLPHREDPSLGPVFDYVDLINAVTFHGSGTTYPELAFRFQLKFAMQAEPSWYEPRTWRITVRPPRPEKEESRTYQCVPPDLDAPGVHAQGGIQPAGDGFDLTVTLTGEPLSVRDPLVLREWAAQQDQFASGEVRYQTVAEPLRADPYRAWALGMADCVVASKVLAGRLAALGLPARARRGYLLGLVGSEHAWCEVFEDGRWRPLDPAFAFATGGRGRDRRFVELPAFSRACRGSRFNRLLPCLAPDAGPLAADGEEPTPPWAPAVVGLAAQPSEVVHAG